MTENEYSVKEIKEMILEAKKIAHKETSWEPEPEFTQNLDWPINCNIGPGLEGAIAGTTKIGYVNGSKGWLIYQGYDIFDLCAHSSFEEVSYLLLHGKLPNSSELKEYTQKLKQYSHIPYTIKMLNSFEIEKMSPMAAMRLGSDLIRQQKTHDIEKLFNSLYPTISADEDSIPMEKKPTGEEKAVYEFESVDSDFDLIDSCYQSIAALASILGAIVRVRAGNLPLEPDPSLSFAGNLLYMMNGKKPTPLEEKVMDICLILHADHGMNASTFATMVVASTLSDIFFSIGAGIAALNGPLHGGANEKVINTLDEIGTVNNVNEWYEKARAEKRKIMGFGHRVYKAYDPRARVLEPLAGLLVKDDSSMEETYKIAKSLERLVVNDMGEDKKIFPNVDYYSGIVYKSMGIAPEYYTPIFAVSRVAGWTAHVVEYLKKNRIFRPRAIYVGDYQNKYVAVEERD